MANNELVRRAAEYAMQAHQRIDHRRKYSGQRYEVHLKQVALLIAEACGSDAMQSVVRSDMIEFWLLSGCVLHVRPIAPLARLRH